MKIFNHNFFEKRWVAYTVALCIAVVLYLFLSNIGIFGKGLVAIFDFVYPVFMGLCIAYILNPLVDLIEKYLLKGIQKRPGLRRGLAVFIGVIGVLVLLILLCIMVIPPIVTTIASLVNDFDKYLEHFQEIYNTFFSNADAVTTVDLSNIANFGNNILDNIISYAKENSGTIITTTVGIGKHVANVIIAFIVSLYFLADKRNLIHGMSKMVRVTTTEKRYLAIADFWSRCNKILSRFIVFDILDGCIVGVANAIFMTIAQMPFIALLSLVVGVTNLAPTFGPIVGCVIGCVLLLIVNPWQAFVFLIFTIILQTIDGYILKPKLFGGTYGVSSVWILISIIVFGRMFGIVGILLAIPLAAIIDFIYKDFIWVKLAERKRNRGEKVPE